MNMAKGGRIRNWFIGQFKTYAICRAIHRMGESDACILQLAKADGILRFVIIKVKQKQKQKPRNVNKTSKQTKT